MLSTFLQSALPEDARLDSAVQSLSQSSIELAEAASNYGALKVIFGVFMVFIIIMIVLLIYTIWNLNSKVSTIETSAKKSEAYFNGAADSTIGKTEAQILIRREVNCLGHILKYSIIRIRLENHIDNKEATKKKIDVLVNNEFSELQGLFSNFTVQGKTLSVVLEHKDTEAIKDLLKEQVYLPKDQFSIHRMDESVSLFLNGLKLMYIKNLQQ